MHLDSPRMMSSSEWQTITATGGIPVLFLPDCRRTVVAKLRAYLEKGEVQFGSGLCELEELKDLLKLLHVTIGLQVPSTKYDFYRMVF